MNRIAITAVLCLVPALAAADRVYTWTDDRGVPHYSDQPKVPQARELSPARMNLYQRRDSIVRVPEDMDPGDADDNGNAENNDFDGYDRLSIASPEHDSVVRDNLGNVSVQLALEPDLQPGHRVQARIGDEDRGEFESLSFIIPEVHRGSWDLTVHVVDEEGERLIESDTVTFHMLQASRLN